MKASLTVADVLHDVEIELMQSAVTHNELGHSVGAVRGHMNRLRSEFLDHARLPGDDRKLAAAQFELADMVLTLLEETAIRLQAIQWEQQRLLRRLVPGPEALAAQAGSARQPVVAGGSSGAEADPSYPAGRQDALGEAHAVRDASLSPPDDAWARRAAALQKLLDEERLRVQVDVQASGAPVVGPALVSLKTALHSLVVFYVNRFAERQGAVNQALGEWVLDLQDAARRQQDEIDLLRGEVRAIQAQIEQNPAPAAPERQGS